MGKSLHIFSFALCVLNGVRAQVDPSVMCAGAVEVDGIAYKTHVDCDKFIECSLDPNGKLTGWEKQCPFGARWDMSLLSCVAVDKSTCENDKCAARGNGEIYRAENNCRGYWECLNGKSQPRCCAMGQRFDKDLLECVHDKEGLCNVTCFTGRFDVPKVCDKYEIPGEIGYFNQDVAGWGTLKLPCAPGTGFDQATCNCIRFVDIGKPVRVCKPEIHLPFTVDHRDMSGSDNYVANVGVTFRNGRAIFDGRNSRLVIPRFSNLEHSSTIVIKIKYTSDHSRVTGMSHALVSNNGCGNIPTLLIAEDNSNIYVGVATDKVTFAYTFAPQISEQSKDLVYRFDNSTLTGSLAGSSGPEYSNGVTDAPGYLRNARCALQIGYADSLVPFKGEIDEISIYLCNPDI